MIKALLSELDLGELLKALATVRANAVIKIQERGLQGRIYLREGRLIYAATEPGPHLGEYLVRLRLLGIEEAQALVLRQGRENPGTPLGQLALQEGLVSPEELRQALWAQVLESLASLLGLSEGLLVAEPEPPNASQVPLLEGFEVGPVLHEAARCLDEWQRGELNPEAVLRLSGDPTRYPISSEAWSLLELIDGVKRARSIALESDLPESQVYHILHELKSRGIVEEAPIRPDDPLILVVAESVLVRRLLLLILEQARYRVLLPSSPEGAQRILQRHRPSAILLQSDEALRLASEFRKLPGGRFTPLWIIDENPPRGLAWRRLRLQHLPRPFSETQLLSALSSIRRPL
jgi:CheY-like chemotaxis protein